MQITMHIQQQAMIESEYNQQLQAAYVDFKAPYIRACCHSPSKLGSAATKHARSFNGMHDAVLISDINSLLTCMHEE